MDMLHTVHGMRTLADRLRSQGRRLVLVPTMGSLHEGHLALVREARRHGDHVTISIFVNPTQFGPNEDYERYPRDLEADLALLTGDAAVEAVFAPTVAEMYPDGRQGLTWIEVERLGDRLCGARRPGHFRGVTTVVAKLFSACKPHAAVFGLKDAQQFLILSRMARDLDMDVEVLGLDTVREADGLALSSRNRYLSVDERVQAVALSRAVFATRDRILAGDKRPEDLVRSMREILAQAPLGRVDYAEIVDADALQPVEVIESGETYLAAVAVWFGGARLIDNRIVTAP